MMLSLLDELGCFYFRISWYVRLAWRAVVAGKLNSLGTSNNSFSSHVGFSLVPAFVNLFFFILLLVS